MSSFCMTEGLLIRILGKYKLPLSYRTSLSLKKERENTKDYNAPFAPLYLAVPLSVFHREGCPQDGVSLLFSKKYSKIFCVTERFPIYL